MKCKRFAALLVVLVLCWTPVFADDTAALLYNGAVTLLTGTSNVTLNGSATFSLDGEPFKFADTAYIQDGVNSEWILDLATPRMDGSLKKSGFTIVANNRWKYAMEVYEPGVLKVVECGSQSAILRPSATLTQLTSLGRVLVEQMPAWTGNEIAYTEPGQWSLHIGQEQIPGAVNDLLSLGVRLAVQRTLGIVDDSVSAPEYPASAIGFDDIAYGAIPTRVIIDCTEKYELTALDADIQMDEAGRFTKVSGTADFVLHTFQDGEHKLTVTFSGKAFDYGTSKAPVFDAEEYGVVTDEGTVFGPFEDFEPCVDVEETDPAIGIG